MFDNHTHKQIIRIDKGPCKLIFIYSISSCKKKSIYIYLLNYCRQFYIYRKWKKKHYGDSSIYLLPVIWRWLSGKKTASESIQNIAATLWNVALYESFTQKSVWTSDSGDIKTDSWWLCMEWSILNKISKLWLFKKSNLFYVIDKFQANWS